MNTFAKVLLVRFGRAFVASAVASMLLLAPSIISDWKDLSNWLGALAVAGVVGGVTGLLQALDKAFRWEE